ncbi:hypothetical protein NQ314_000400 [Rhamnusium bicolor]|uniref:BAG domain-containing protein n=1 Tax=Rhamnusium bicolor TaxID=1586634 RepID=A0AAV8ZW36_9CUCU|nr:hypothetical protein NQ314_000400 [Rhamnusium bicolor]
MGLISNIKGKDSDENQPTMKRSWSLRRSKKKKKEPELNPDSENISKKTNIAENKKEEQEEKSLNKKSKSSHTYPTKLQLIEKEEEVKVSDTDVQQYVIVTVPKEVQVNTNEEIVTSNTEEIEANCENHASYIVDAYEEKCLKRIYEILEKSREFESKIDTFSDITGSQQFYYLDENLQRNIEKLDRIDIRESTRLKEERTNAIKFIYNAIERLETQAQVNENIQSNGINTG